MLRPGSYRISNFHREEWVPATKIGLYSPFKNRGALRRCFLSGHGRKTNPRSPGRFLIGIKRFSAISLSLHLPLASSIVCTSPRMSFERRQVPPLLRRMTSEISLSTL